MRTATAHQQSPTANSKITLVVGGDTYTTEGAGGDERILRVYPSSSQGGENPWGSGYSIELDNSDEALNSKDYKGNEITLTFSFIEQTADSLPPYWIDSQEFSSREGRLILRLNCIDAWGLLSTMRTTLVNAQFNQSWQHMDELKKVKRPDKNPLSQAQKDEINANYGITGKAIIDKLLTAYGFSASLLDVADNDGIIDTEKPPVSASNPISGIRQALDMSKCYLLWRRENGAGVFRLIKEDAHDTAYSYNVADLFFSNVESVGITIPNRIKFWSWTPAGDAWHCNPNGTKANPSAEDWESAERLGSVANPRWIDRHYPLWSLSEAGVAKRTQAELTQYAEGQLYKVKAERSQGILVAPMHVSQELFDKITVIDDRYATPKTTTGYVHRIIREYDRGVYRVTIQLGGVTSGYTPPGGVEAEGLAEAEPSKIPALSHPPGIQAYIASVSITPTAWDAVQWSAGNVQLMDGNTQTIDAGSLINMLAGVYYLYCIWGNSTLQSSQSYSDAVGDDRMLVAVTSRGSSSAVMAYALNPHTDSILINRDKVMDGLVNDLKLASEAVTEAKIAANAVTGGKIQAGAIAAGHIAAGAVVADKIAAGAVTAIKIDVATLDAISANVGTLTSGTINGVTIYAGNENVILDVNGLKIIDKYLTFKTGAAECSLWLASSTRLVLDAGFDLDVQEHLWIHAGEVVGIHTSDAAGNIYFRTKNVAGNADLDHVFCPSTLGSGSTGWGYIGNATYWWYKMYSQFYYYKTAPQAFQDFDDVALIKAMKSKKQRDKDGREVERIDIATLPKEVKIREERDDKPGEFEEFIDSSAMTGLLIGAIKQLAAKVDKLEVRLK